VRRRVPALLLALGAALALAAAASAGNGGFAPVTPASPGASRINDAYKLILVITAIIFVLVEGALITFIVRYRRRGRARTAEGPQVHGATRLELIWTAIPVLIVAGIAAFVLYKLPGIRDTPSAKAAGAPLHVRIDGHQFYWQFTYPTGQISIDELHVPAHQVVEVEIHSQDVDHSWWIPALQGKFDAIPGKVNHTWFQAERTGTYSGQCGEFCGVYHEAMVARVIATDASGYRAYLRAVQDPLVLGGQEWRGTCAQCHGIAGTGGYGPNIQSNALLTQKAGLTKLLMNGQNILKPVGNYMPPVGRGWTNAQIDALMAYMKQHVYKAAVVGR
jgi:cytochrome c oxidase subunit II